MTLFGIVVFASLCVLIFAGIKVLIDEIKSWKWGKR